MGARFAFPFETGRVLGVERSASGGGACRLLTLFALECVVAVAVAKRGTSAPAEVDGIIVLRREDFERLLERATEDFDVESAVLGSGCEVFLSPINESGE